MDDEQPMTREDTSDSQQCQNTQVSHSVSSLSIQEYHYNLNHRPSEWPRYISETSRQPPRNSHLSLSNWTLPSLNTLQNLSGYLPLESVRPLVQSQVPDSSMQTTTLFDGTRNNFTNRRDPISIIQTNIPEVTSGFEPSSLNIQRPLVTSFEHTYTRFHGDVVPPLRLIAPRTQESFTETDHNIYNHYGMQSRPDLSSTVPTQQEPSSGFPVETRYGKRGPPREVMLLLETVNLEDLEKSDRYSGGISEIPMRLPKCKHVFGDKCIKEWFERSDSCPYCRDQISTDPPKKRNCNSENIRIPRERFEILPPRQLQEALPPRFSSTYYSQNLRPTQPLESSNTSEPITQLIARSDSLVNRDTRWHNIPLSRRHYRDRVGNFRQLHPQNRQNSFGSTRSIYLNPPIYGYSSISPYPITRSSQLASIPSHSTTVSRTPILNGHGLSSSDSDVPNYTGDIRAIRDQEPIPQRSSITSQIVGYDGAFAPFLGTVTSLTDVGTSTSAATQIHTQRLDETPDGSRQNFEDISSSYDSDFNNASLFQPGYHEVLSNSQAQHQTGIDPQLFPPIYVSDW